MKDKAMFGTYNTSSAEETENLGKKLAYYIQPGDVIAFTGGLAAGKTSFVRGLAEGLQFKGDVSSPTFAIVNEYLGGRLPLYHFDMYRVESFEDLLSCGFYDYLDAGAVLAVEWSENIIHWLPENTTYINIALGEDENRRILKISEDSM